MSELAAPGASPIARSRLPDQALSASATLWFVVAAAGQWLFVYFIAMFYYGRTLGGDFAAWNDKGLIVGYKAGDDVGNLFFAAHVLVAAIITAAGTFQLVPYLRTRARWFHRWNGRVFIATAVLMALGGLWMTWVRPTYLNLIGAWGITLNAVLILFFSGMALRTAMAREFNAHRRWALRAFMVVNGVWFMRVGYSGWGILTHGAGVGSRMDGPFDIFLAFGNSLLPLAVLELYLIARDRSGGTTKLAVAGIVTAAALFTALGAVGAWLIMWGPDLSSGPS